MGANPAPPLLLVSVYSGVGVFCAELEKGQMLHADSFNLGDSMSALEMMDPKMDAGVINEKNKSIVPAGLHTALFCL